MMMNISSMMPEGPNFVKQTGFLLGFDGTSSIQQGRKKKVDPIFNWSEPISSQEHITFLRLAEIKTPTKLTTGLSSQNVFVVKLCNIVHIYEAMKPQLTLQQSISKRISFHPCCKGSEDQVSYLSRMLDAEHMDCSFLFSGIMAFVFLQFFSPSNLN